MTQYFTVILLLTLTLATPSSGQQHPDPPDPHGGQLAYCVNHGGFTNYPMEEPHICDCDKPCAKDQPEDAKCKVWCRKDHCHCIAECEREPPPLPPAADGQTRQTKGGIDGEEDATRQGDRGD